LVYLFGDSLGWLAWAHIGGVAMISYKHVLKPTLLFAAGSYAGVAHATVFVQDVNIASTPGGTAIAIGVPLADAQFSFVSSQFSVKPTDPPTPVSNLIANGTAAVAPGTNAIPDGTAPWTNDVKTQFGSANGSYYSLRFDVGGNTYFGYAGVDESGSRITQIAYDAPEQLSIRQSVPEPATWAEMILGFGMAGAALRRRQSAKLARA